MVNVQNMKPVQLCTGFIFCSFPGVDRVKSGNFGHQVNSDIHLQTVEIQMRWLLLSRLIRIFTVCFVNLFLYSIIKI